MSPYESSSPNDAADVRGPIPIIVLSFNRPEYLEQVLESLRTQVPEIDERRIHLFQDGAVNRYSGIQHTEEEDIAECIEIFHDLFPLGHAHISKWNIGICENYLRAERFAFLTLDAPFVYLFEDDLVLADNYLSTLDALRQSFASQPRIAYFNAVGKYKAPIDVQNENRHSIIDMGHMWGFALRQSHWMDMQPLLAPYYRLVCGRDYLQHPKQEIRSFFHQWKLSKPATTQDSAKDIVTNVLDCWRVSTFVCLARYIGEFGVHFNTKSFERRGYPDTQIFDGKIPERFVVEETQIDTAVARIHGLSRARYEKEISQVDER